MSVLDTFPRSNLPPEATPWSRDVEKRIIDAENTIAARGQDIHGAGRTNAATLGALASQVERLGEQVTRIDALYAALPKPEQRTVTTNNFALGSGWGTVAHVTLVPPGPGTYSIHASAQAQLVAPLGVETLVTTQGRIVIDSAPSTPTAGNYNAPDGQWRANLFSAWGATVPVTGNSVEITFQINPDDAATWPSGTGSYAVLAVSATFVGTV